MFVIKISKRSSRFTHTWVKPAGFDTGIKVYNCTAKSKVPLIIKNKNFITWYTCGPTVYDSAHIGHASTYVKLDVIQRILKNYFKIDVITAMNITDIDDKIINRSRERNVEVLELAKEYEKEFWEDMHSLKVTKPNIILRVTENIECIKDFIKQLKQNNVAYTTNKGGVYFNIQSAYNYGKLQNLGTNNLECSDQGEKKNVVDFALWKETKDGEPAWQSDWGPGRPGWHTECSALATSVFGAQIDIHAGGVDLRFPHHENEEAQCCSYYCQPQWVNYWLHTGHLHMQDSVKMSKSLKNTISIRDMLKCCDSNIFRIMCLMSHYSYNMEFNMDYVKKAQAFSNTFINFVSNCNALISGKTVVNINTELLNKTLMESVVEVHNAFIDDFDTATCLKVINSLIATTNIMIHAAPTSVTNNKLSNLVSVISVLNFVTNIYKLLGISLDNKEIDLVHSSDETDNLIDLLINFRQNIRQSGIQSKDKHLMELCDNVRDGLNKIGITVKDHGKISSWSK